MTPSEQSKFDEINVYRVAHGLPELIFDPRMQLAATIPAKWQNENGLAHDISVPGWGSPAQRVANVGLGYVGENAAWNTGDNTVNAWHNSAGHRALLQKPGQYLAGLAEVGSGITLVYGYEPQRR